MEIKFYNSLTNKEEIFKPIIENEVSMYVCGPTVYNHIHVGNLRPIVVFDTLTKFLTYVGYDVTHISNYTDVDDKVIAQAIEENMSEAEVANKYIAAYEENVRLVNADLPTHSPRVTSFIPDIIAFVEKLIEAGAAYEVDGDVFFRVGQDDRYGELGNFDPKELQAGTRIEQDERKESPLDFVVWKKTETGIKWDSPWSEGRPGWHTECVVMIDSLFEEKCIDIHGGGVDLKFPHHENEIAQSLAVNNNKLAKYWMHNGFVNLNDSKMSKSLGNVVLAKDMLAKYGGNVVRMMLISTHYRAPVNFSEEVVEMAINEINKISKTYRQLAVTLQINKVDLTSGTPSELEGFLSELANDLNTANALSQLHRVLKLANSALRVREHDLELLANLFATLEVMLHILGFKITYPILTSEDFALLDEYNLARANKDYEQSDKLREQLIKREIF